MLSSKSIYTTFIDKREIFESYIGNIKKKSDRDIYNIINPTLVKNPHVSVFPKLFLTQKVVRSNKLFHFVKIILQYYLKNIYSFISYCISFILYKIYYKKRHRTNIKTIIDVFGLVDVVNQNNKFSENYLAGIYEVYDSGYSILLRPYGINKNPFKLKKFFKIINENKKDFIFEYDFLIASDFIKISWFLIIYPFKVLRLLEKEHNSLDKIFNYSLIEDIKNTNVESFARYILGKNLAEINAIDKIYSWSEFQNIERSFNYGIRKNNQNIELVALQFFISSQAHLNTVVDDLDFEMLSSPHKVLVNGNYYLKKRKKVKYELGVSLRYKNLFTFKGIKDEKYILLLGSLIESDTKYMLDCMKRFDNIIFKNHPAIDMKRFGELSKNITVSDENIYKLFENTKIIIVTASGTAVEAVACGVSVIIIASQDNLTANPLVDYGKGKIWDIAFSKDDVKRLYNELIEYRANNKEEIKEIASWYKDNFFIEPTEEKIKKIFNIEEKVK